MMLKLILIALYQFKSVGRVRKRDTTVSEATLMVYVVYDHEKMYPAYLGTYRASSVFNFCYTIEFAAHAWTLVRAYINAK